MEPGEERKIAGVFGIELSICVTDRDGAHESVAFYIHAATVDWETVNPSDAKLYHPYGVV